MAGADEKLENSAKRHCAQHREHNVEMALWRRPDTFSDWTFHIGMEAYSVHRVNLAFGKRASKFFAGCFNASFQATSTDLSSLLPSVCHGAVFETALDFMYGCEVIIRAEAVCPLLKIADVLQIDALKSKVDKDLPLVMNRTTAPIIYASASEMMVSDVAIDDFGRVQVEVIAFLVSQFHMLSVADAAALPPGLLESVLISDLLAVDEGHIFDVLVIHMQANEHDEAQIRQLWGACRFAFLPGNRIPEALKFVPSDILVKGLAARIVARTGNSQTRKACPLPARRSGTTIKPVVVDGSNAREYLQAIYSKYNPEKLVDLDALLVKYRGREQIFLEAVVQKYGPLEDL